MFQKEKYKSLLSELKNEVTLVAVSKKKSKEDIMEAYNAGQRDFGENYVQELLEKQPALPDDIRWHFIGHLQSNKVKYIAPFVHLIHGIDSIKLLQEVNKQGEKTGKIINVLLQVHIAQEETKFGFDEVELNEIDADNFPFVEICGLMGMASFSDNDDHVRREFQTLSALYKNMKTRFTNFSYLSMGMSSDYKIAIEEGSKMVRIGSMLFGERRC